MRILTEPQNALVRQYRDLLGTEGVALSFTDDAVARDGPLRRRASTTPPRTSAPAASRRSSRPCSTRSRSRPAAPRPSRSRVDAAYVRRRLEPLVKSQDLSRFIL